MSDPLAVMSATLYVGAVWGASLLVLCGLGRLVQRAFGITKLSSDRMLSAYWAGYAVVIAFLQVWHMALPVNPVAGLVLGLGGFAGLWTSRAELERWGRDALGRPLTLLLGGLVFLWLANIATGPCQLGDTGMYHLPMARWMAEYRILPGLANLHGRLGLNNSNLLLAALFESGPFEGRSHHLLQGPMVLAFLASAFGGARRWLSSPTRVPSHLFLTFFAAPVTFAALSRHFTSLSTDIPTALLMLVVAWRLTRLVEHAPERATPEGPEPQRRFEITLVAALLATAVSTKLPALPYAVLGTSIALVIGWRAEEERKLVTLRAPLLVVMAFALPWLLRGVIVSGLPVYPDSTISVPVEWRVPLAQADALHSWALDSCRLNGLHGPGGEWLDSWLSHLAAGVLASLPTVMTLTWWLLLAAFSLFARSHAKRPAGWPALLLLACLASAVAWFFLGPNPRFGFGILWAVAASSAALTVHVFPGLFAKRLVRILAVCACLTCSAYTVSYLMNEPKLNWRTRWLVREAGKDAGLHPYRSVEVEEYVTDSGLVLNVPTANSNNTWAEALPATCYPAPNLRLRRPGDISSGFVTDGEWQPLRWPKVSSRYLQRWRSQQNR